MARSYSTHSMAHALGYVGSITPKLLERPQYSKYQPGEFLGITGLESYYEKQLLGRRGVRYRMVNVRGIEKGAFRGGEYDTLSVAGQDLHLSLDSDLQAYAEQLMAGKRGSVVAIDPKTGRNPGVRIGPACSTPKCCRARAWATATWSCSTTPNSRCSTAR